jgi:hypothetical protein
VFVISEQVQAPLTAGYRHLGSVPLWVQSSVAGARSLGRFFLRWLLFMNKLDPHRGSPSPTVRWAISFLIRATLALHPKRQIEQLRASIEAFGFTNPILPDPDGRIIAGHGRLQAARAMGLAEVPTIVLCGLSEAQKRALRIADNKIALNAGWDLEILKMGELASIDVDIDPTLRLLDR